MIANNSLTALGSIDNGGQEIEIYASLALRRPTRFAGLIAQSQVVDKRKNGNTGLGGSAQKGLPELFSAYFTDERISACLDGYDIILAIVKGPVLYENTCRVGEIPDDNLRLIVMKFESDRRKGRISIRCHAFTQSIERVLYTTKPGLYFT
jgi:hypothetical protein